MDVKIVFLNSFLKEEIYMSRLERFIFSGRANQVYKLKKFIYGLKQASRSWNIHFDKTIKEPDFIKNVDEPCMYKKTSGSVIIFLILSVRIWMHSGIWIF